MLQSITWDNSTLPSTSTSIIFITETSKEYKTAKKGQTVEKAGKIQSANLNFC